MPEDREREGSDPEAEEEAEEEREDSGQRSKSRSADATRRAAADEDEDDDEDKDEDEDEDEPPKRSTKPAKKQAPKPARRETRPADRKKRLAPAKPVLPPENEIRAPSRETITWLAVMAGATLLMWGSARFACNAHPAQTRKPREISTAELARDPKDAALEMQQRWNSYDFKGALELASGPVAEDLKKGKGECEGDAKACEQKRKAVADKALATAALLSREGGIAKVRVTSLGGAGGEQTVVYTLSQEGPSWKVNGRTADVAPSPAPSAAPPASGR
jgi:hypothetical protein